VQIGGHRSRVDQHGRGPLALDQRIAGHKANLGQFDLAGPMQHQQQASAEHVAQGSVGLTEADGEKNFWEGSQCNPANSDFSENSA